MNTHNLCFRGEIRKYVDTLSNLELCSPKV